MDYKTAVEFLRRRDKAGNSNIRIIDAESLGEIADFITKQEKYAELGRLALTTMATVCGSSDFKKFANRCEKHCTNYPFCQKRSELLTEVQTNGNN